MSKIPTVNTKPPPLSDSERESVRAWLLRAQEGFERGRSRTWAMAMLPGGEHYLAAAQYYKHAAKATAKLLSDLNRGSERAERKRGQV